MSYNRMENINYSKIITPDNEYTWCYSYLELQCDLNNICRNHTLKKVYAGLHGYLESYSQSKNYYDFSYLGGSVILLFDNIAIEFSIYGVGLIQYRKINPWEIKIKNIKDFPPSNMGSQNDNYFYDLGNQFDLSFEGKKVKSVLIDNVDYYPFPLADFNEEKAKIAENTKTLPNKIHFLLDNDVDLGIYAHDIENFYIELKK